MANWATLPSKVLQIFSQLFILFSNLLVVVLGSVIVEELVSVEDSLREEDKYPIVKKRGTVHPSMHEIAYLNRNRKRLVKFINFH